MTTETNVYMYKYGQRYYYFATTIKSNKDWALKTMSSFQQHPVPITWNDYNVVSNLPTRSLSFFVVVVGTLTFDGIDMTCACTRWKHVRSEFYEHWVLILEDFASFLTLNHVVKSYDFGSSLDLPKKNDLFLKFKGFRFINLFFNEFLQQKTIEFQYLKQV